MYINMATMLDSKPDPRSSMRGKGTQKKINEKRYKINTNVRTPDTHTQYIVGGWAREKPPSTTETRKIKHSGMKPTRSVQKP